MVALGSPSKIYTIIIIKDVPKDQAVLREVMSSWFPALCTWQAKTKGEFVHK